MTENWSPAHRALDAIRELRHRYETLKNRINEPIAIVGSACRFPGANSPEDYWELLKQGRNAVTEIPENRWPKNDYYDPDPAMPGKMYARHGGFIDDVAAFDHLLFGVSEEEAIDMDPQQRILLELCWEAMERAGIPPRGHSDNHRTGVFVGLATHDYSRAHIDSGNAEMINNHAFTGTSFSIASGRIAYLLGLQGPAMTVDTACSSSLVALHLACQSLRNDECELALAGGMNVLADPHRFVYFCKTAALSANGCCRTFDADADGYVRSEGGGVVVLKRLSAAQAANDDILAVIHGSGVNHDGQSNGLTAPNGLSQQRLIRQVLQKASIPASSLGYVECHGTGTPLGDPIEVNALGEILAEQREASANSCYLGACKTNLGHLEAAAGIAGLLKTAMVVNHGQIPPNLHLQTPNPYIDWSSLPVTLPDELLDWPAQGQRFASVSAFGFGGTNAHLVVGSPPTHEPAAGPQLKVPELVLLSAESEDRLRALVRRYLDYLDATPIQQMDETAFFNRLAYTSQQGRTALRIRLACCVGNIVAFKTALLAYLDEKTRPGTFCGVVDDRVPENDFSGRDVAWSTEALASHWVDGGRVDWPSIYGEGDAPAKLALPCYPFVRATFWKPLPGCGLPNSTAVQPEQQPVSERTAASEPEAANTSTRERLLACFARRLNRPVAEIAQSAGPTDLRIDSMRMLQLRFELERAFGTAVAMQQLAGGATWDEIAATLESAPQEQTPEPERQSQTDNHEADTPFPLTELQEAYLFGREYADRVGCHLYLELEHRHLDIERLNGAWNILVSHHPMLRMAITEDGKQQVRNIKPYTIQVFDQRETEPKTREEHLAQVRETLSHNVYAADDWPLYSIQVTQLDNACSRIHFSIDELIVDGASISLLLRQWQSLYKNPQQTLPVANYSFRRHVHEQKSRRESAQGKRDLSFWMERCQDLPPAPMLAAPANDARSSSHQRRRFKASLSPTEWQGLQARAESLKVSPTVLLLSVFCETLALAGAQDTSFSLVLTLFNRLSEQADANALIGPFASSALFINPTGGRSLDERCNAIQQSLWQGLEHSSVNSITVLRELRRRGQLAADFTLPVVFTSMIENFESSDFEENWSTDWVYAITQTPQVYLDHQACVRYGALHLSWDVAIDHFDEAHCYQVFLAYHHALALLANNPNCQLDELREQLSADCGQPKAPADPTGSYPMTDLQSAYLFGRLMDHGAGCMVYQEFHLQTLDVSALEEAINQLIKRHPMLRASISGEGYLVFHTDAPRYTVKKESGDTSDKKLLASLRASMINQVFSPGDWPLFQIAVSKHGEQWCVHIVIDMLIADAPSIYQLYSELFANYFLRPVEASRAHYAHYIEQVVQSPDNAVLAAADRYWQERFARLPAAPALDAGRNTQRQRFEYSFADLTALQQFADAHRLQLQDLLFAVYMEVLEAWAGEAISVVVVDFDRPEAGASFAQCIGDFTWVSWLGSNDAESEDFCERAHAFAAQLKQDRRSCFPVSGLRVLRRLRPARRFPIVFSRLLEHGKNLPREIEWGYGVSRTPQVCLDNVSMIRDGALHIHWDALDGAFPTKTVEQLFSRYVARLEDLAGTHSKRPYSIVSGQHR